MRSPPPALWATSPEVFASGKAKGAAKSPPAARPEGPFLRFGRCSLRSLHGRRAPPAQVVVPTGGGGFGGRVYSGEFLSRLEPEPPVSEVTRVLSAIEQGDPRAAEQLLPLVYEELRKLAAQKLAQEKPTRSGPTRELGFWLI